MDKKEPLKPPPIITHCLNAMNHIKDQRFKEGKCPECGDKLKNQSGCQQCHSCGWSACG